MEKRYVLASPALAKYSKRAPKKQAPPKPPNETNMVEVQELMLDGELERVANLLDPEEVKYAGEAGLTDILTLQKICQEIPATDVSKEAVEKLEALVAAPDLPRKHHRLAVNALRRVHRRERREKGKGGAPPRSSH